MPLHLKLKRKAAEFKAKKMDEKQLEEQLNKDKIRDCQAFFKVQTRNQAQEVEKQKHQSPPMGQYNIKFNLVTPNDFKVIPFNIVPHEPNLGMVNKNKTFVSQMRICPHALRTLEKLSDLKGNSSLLRSSLLSSPQKNDSPRKSSRLSPRKSKRFKDGETDGTAGDIWSQIDSSHRPSPPKTKRSISITQSHRVESNMDHSRA